MTGFTAAGFSIAGFSGMVDQMVRSIATRGRIAAMLSVAAIFIAVGIVIDRSADVSGLQRVEFLGGFALLIFVPLASVVMATATLGNLVEEKTLVYLWLRPIGRSQIAIAAWLASLVVLIPVVVLPMALFGWILGNDGNDIVGIVVASLIGVIGYSVMFTLLGLLTKRALLWGVVYVVVWEGFIAGWSRTTGWLALRTHTLSALDRISDAPLIDQPTEAVTLAILVAALVAAGIGLTTLRLTRMDVD